MPDPCQSIMDQIMAAQAELSQLAKQEEQILGGHSSLGPAPEGPDKGHQIEETTKPYRDLLARISQLQNEYDNCRMHNGGKPALTASVTGHVSVLLDGSTSNLDVPLKVTFNEWHHRTWEIDTASIPPLTIGGYEVTVSVTGNSGTFAPSTGHMTLDLQLELVVHGPAGNATASFHLSSAHSGGSRMSKTGKHTVTITDTSVLHEGGVIHPEDNHPISLSLSFAMPTYP